MNKKAHSVIITLTLAGLLGGCQATQTTEHAQRGAVFGTILGGVLGAVAGHQKGKTVEGAAIGAVAGGTAGAVLGNSKDQRVDEVNYEKRQAEYQVQLARQQRLEQERAIAAGSRVTDEDILRSRAKTDALALEVAAERTRQDAAIARTRALEADAAKRADLERQKAELAVRADGR